MCCEYSHVFCCTDIIIIIIIITKHLEIQSGFFSVLISIQDWSE